MDRAGPARLRTIELPCRKSGGATSKPHSAPHTSNVTVIGSNHLTDAPLIRKNQGGDPIL